MKPGIFCTSIKCPWQARSLKFEIANLQNKSCEETSFPGAGGTSSWGTFNSQVCKSAKRFSPNFLLFPTRPSPAFAAGGSVPRAQNWSTHHFAALARRAHLGQLEFANKKKQPEV